ncbi:EF-hand domain-containing protein [Sphaerisporangium album]|uniref:EF-hand domain-containing protein n=1 Tax=Sphaerisporangium album TaxID=509200 RepID=A0A367EWF8_9ACTN|nr:EF-hand domain-containing protein [Sphaerisporangium album]RCG22468.1 EF-hand domain-containing protein [Sphaerisporangium album]
MSEYAVTFDLVDADKDGLISAGEFLRLMEVLGQPVSQEAADAAVARLDSDGDGLISLDEFSAYLSSAR